MIRTHIAGVTFRKIADQVRYANLADGEPLVLTPEPTNKYDPNAIKVLTEDGHWIGYVPATRCSEVLALPEFCARWIDGKMQIEEPDGSANS